MPMSDNSERASFVSRGCRMFFKSSDSDFYSYAFVPVLHVSCFSFHGHKAREVLSFLFSWNAEQDKKCRYCGKRHSSINRNV